MQISVGLPSRNRPLDMVASAISLFRLASGTHDVRVIIATDSDDRESRLDMRALAKEFGERLFPFYADRPHGLGQLHNAMNLITDREAAFVLWSDRLHVITPSWDHAVAVSCMQFPNRVLWLDSVHLQGPGQFILPPAWRAAQGAPCPGIYPFWFEDSAVEEIDAFVHGFPRVCVPAQCAGARHLPTQRLRDLPFWIDVFAATRPQRIEQSKEIAAKLGVKWRERLEELRYFEARDVSFRQRAAQLEQTCSDPEPPDETYVAAKARAEAMMQELRV